MHRARSVKVTPAINPPSPATAWYRDCHTVIQITGTTLISSNQRGATCRPVPAMEDLPFTVRFNGFTDAGYCKISPAHRWIEQYILDPPRRTLAVCNASTNGAPPVSEEKIFVVPPRHRYRRFNQNRPTPRLSSAVVFSTPADRSGEGPRCSGCRPPPRPRRGPVPAGRDGDPVISTGSISIELPGCVPAARPMPIWFNVADFLIIRRSRKGSGVVEYGAASGDRRLPGVSGPPDNATVSLRDFMNLMSVYQGGQPRPLRPTGTAHSSCAERRTTILERYTVDRHKQTIAVHKGIDRD